MFCQKKYAKKNHPVHLSSLTTKKTCTGFAAFTNTWPVAISPLLTAGSSGGLEVTTSLSNFPICSEVTYVRRVGVLALRNDKYFTKIEV